MSANLDQDGDHVKMSPWIPEKNPIRLAVLGKLLEEVNELGAVLARSIIQGVDEFDPDTHELNRTVLEQEMADVDAGIEMALRHFCSNRAVFAHRSTRKLHHYGEWHELIRQREDTHGR